MNSTAEKALILWLQTYHDSVGGAANECLQLYAGLRQRKLVNEENLSLMQDLLNVLSGLSPDPHTVSCAMLLVVCESGEDLTAVRAE